MATAFHDQLVATRNRKHSKNHPFFDLWAREADQGTDCFLTAPSIFTSRSEYLNWLAYEASQIPQRDVKAYLFENLGDQENPEDRHLDMLKDYVASCGVNPDSVEGSIVLGGTDQPKIRPLPVGLPNPLASRARQSRCLYWLRVSSFWISAERKSFRRCTNTTATNGAKQRIRFFEEHIHADEVHGSKGFAIVEKYADTQQLQALALKTVEEATIRRWRYMNSIYWYTLHDREDDTPTLRT